MESGPFSGSYLSPLASCYLFSFLSGFTHSIIDSSIHSGVVDLVGDARAAGDFVVPPVGELSQTLPQLWLKEEKSSAWFKVYPWILRIYRKYLLLYHWRA